MNLNEAWDELQSIDPNNVGAWPTFVYILMCLLVLGVVIFGGHYQFVTPNIQQLERITAEEPGLKKEFEKKQAKAANLDAYKEQLAEMERSFGSMLRQLPSKTEVANLLNDISQARVAAGLEEELFKPLSEQPRDFYAVLPNKVVATGSYHEIADFVSRVAALPRIVTVDEVKISSANRGSELKLEAMLNTYRYLTEDEE